MIRLHKVLEVQTGSLRVSSRLWAGIYRVIDPRDGSGSFRHAFPLIWAGNCGLIEFHGSCEAFAQVFDAQTGSLRVRSRLWAGNYRVIDPHDSSGSFRHAFPPILAGNCGLGGLHGGCDAFAQGVRRANGLSPCVFPPGGRDLPRD